MRIWDIYQTAITMGIDSDPRGREAVLERLGEQQSDYDAAPKTDENMLDKELLNNPYPDTRLLYGDPDQAVKHVFVGIDIGPGELAVVDRLNDKGAGIDMVIAHHPEGIALTTLALAMDMQTDIFHCCGVPVNIAEQILQGEAQKTTISIITGNYNRTVDAAQLLGLPLMCTHTPTDNLVQKYWEDRFAETKPTRIKQIMAMLNAEPEYIEASKLQAGPMLLAGSDNNRVGKIMVDMTGGTDAGPKMYKQLGAAGVGTIVAMHMSNGTLEVLQEQHINVILAGHMSSDSMGLNLFLDALEKAGIKITAGSGLTRFSRLEKQ